MALTLLEKLLASKNPARDIAVLAERVREIEVALIEAKALEDEHKAIKAALVGYVDEIYASDEEIKIETDRIEIAISTKDFVRQITDIPALFDFLGKKRFLDLCKFPISELDTYVPKAKQKQFVRKTRSGARTYKVTILRKGKSK